MFDNKITLSQTDTTVGFISNNHNKLSDVKQRPRIQPFINVTTSLKNTSSIGRVPKKFRKLVRHSSKTSFILKNKKISFRVIKNHPHSNLLKKMTSPIFSSSANLTKEKFDMNFASKNSDIIHYSKYDFSEKSASKIYILGKNKKKRVR